MDIPSPSKFFPRSIQIKCDSISSKVPIKSDAAILISLIQRIMIQSKGKGGKKIKSILRENELDRGPMKPADSMRAAGPDLATLETGNNSADPTAISLNHFG